MAVTINDIFVTMMNYVHYEEYRLFNELTEKTRDQLEAIYVAANMRPGTVIELETPLQLETARDFVQGWFPSVLPVRIGELAMKALLVK
jgi:hypothetical protein